MAYLSTHESQSKHDHLNNPPKQVKTQEQSAENGKEDRAYTPQQGCPKHPKYPAKKAEV